MFRTLPGAKQADSLVSISILRGGFSFPMGMSYPNYKDFAQLKEAFSGAIVSSFMTARLSDNLNDPRRAQLTMVSGKLLRVSRGPDGPRPRLHRRGSQQHGLGQRAGAEQR
jgi:hypothetical protein